MSIQLRNFTPHKSLDAHFRDLSSEISEQMRSFGVDLPAFRDPSLPAFTKLSDEKKLYVLGTLTYQRDFFDLASKEKLPINSAQLLWRMLKKMNLTPPSDAFDKIHEDDMVEIYTTDGGILFKNLRFYNLVSLSLEEVFSMKWYEQIRFSPKMFLFFAEVQTKFHMGSFEHGFVPSVVKQYTVREKLGQKRRMQAQMKWVSPLQGDSHDGLLIVSRANLAPNRP